LPLQMLVCTGMNQFRKPSILLWEHFVATCNAGIEPDHALSFYCGDAAGRIKNWAPGKSKVLVSW
jgi:bifunctional polynucleotide phosphatase/kinase